MTTEEQLESLNTKMKLSELQLEKIDELLGFFKNEMISQSLKIQFLVDKLIEHKIIPSNLDNEYKTYVEAKIKELEGMSETSTPNLTI